MWGRVALFALLATLSVGFTMATALSVADFLKLLFGDGMDSATVGGNNLVDKGLRTLYNWLIVGGKQRALVGFSLLVLATYSLKNIFSYLAAISMASLRLRMLEGIRNEMAAKISRLTSAYYTRHKKGDVLMRFSGDCAEYDENMLGSLQLLISAVVSLVGYLTMLLYISPKLTLAVGCMLPVAAGVISVVTRRLKRNSVELQERGAGLMSLMEETMMGLKIIKSYTAINFSNRRFRMEDAAYTKMRVGVYRRIDSASPISDFLGNVTVIAILLMGSMLVMGGEKGLTPELFISYIMMFVLMITPAKDLTTAVSQMKKGRGCEERLQQLLDEKEEDAGGTRQFAGLSQGIEFRHVFVRYDTPQQPAAGPAGEDRSGDDDGWVLNDINLTIPRGGQVALVGSSGSGKSTLADMVGRFVDATKGEVLIDGVDIRDYDVASLRRGIGVVSQESILMNDSVANNISFGTAATQGEIEEAARVANAHAFTMEMENGYATNVGDKGDCLSGGQRQRICIARAVLRKPDILILDEATSALDTESEHVVQQALDHVMQGRTSIVIAHRLSTIAHIKDIVVIERGRIVERGSHDELMSLGGRYKELVELQSIEK